jgi:Secretion system C-terminal sorting domain
MKHIIILFFIVSFCIQIFSQIPPPESFFPSAVGDVWEYQTQTESYKSEIIKDSIDIIGNQYLFYPSILYGNKPRIKIDTSYNVFQLDFISDTVLWYPYKLNADSGETWVYDKRYNEIARVNDIFQTYIFGKLSYVKDIGYYDPGAPGDTIITDSSMFISDTWLVSGIGEYYEYRAEEGPTMQLLGCIINGDTLGTITSIKENILQTPTDFKLYQNYPNPFNPNTTIEFDINEYSRVNIKIYNILGKYISTILNGYKNIGSYKILFKGEDLPSGIYFYTINVNGKTETKSMVLIK